MEKLPNLTFLQHFSPKFPLYYLYISPLIRVFLICFSSSSVFPASSSSPLSQRLEPSQTQDLGPDAGKSGSDKNTIEGWVQQLGRGRLVLASLNSKGKNTDVHFFHSSRIQPSLY